MERLPKGLQIAKVNKKQELPHIVLRWLPFTMTAAAACWAIVHLARQYPSYHWIATKGTVVYSSYPESAGEPGASEVALTYEYLVGETKYKCDQFGIWRKNYRGDAERVRDFGIQNQPGDIVTVYYDPKNPGKAVLAPGPDWSKIGSPFLLALFASMVIWLRNEAWRTWNKNRASA